MFNLFGERESAERILDRLANRAYDAVPEDFQRFGVRCWADNGEPNVALFALLTNGAVRQIALSPEAGRNIRDDFRKLWSVHKKAEPQPWTEATIAVTDEGAFELTFGYDKLDFAQRDNMEQSWRDRHLPPTPSIGIRSPELEEMAAQAMEEYRLHTAAHDALWHIASAESWHIDQGREVIEFFFKDGGLASAPAQIIGSWNSAECRWLWAWANPSAEDQMRRHALTVRQYGQEHNFPELTNPDLRCDENTAWKLTAFAAQLNKAQGIYRALTAAAAVFISHGGVTLSPGGSVNVRSRKIGC